MAFREHSVHGGKKWRLPCTAIINISHTTHILVHGSWPKWPLCTAIRNTPVSQLVYRYHRWQNHWLILLETPNWFAAPPLANTQASGSKQAQRAKPEGSPDLLCAYWTVVMEVPNRRLWQGFGSFFTKVSIKTPIFQYFWIHLDDFLPQILPRCIVRDTCYTNASP